MELLTNQRIGEKAMPFHLRLCSVFSLPFSRFPLPFHWIRDSRQVRGAGNAGRGSRRAGEEAAAATRKRGREWRGLPAREVKQLDGVPPHLLERGDSPIGPLNYAARGVALQIRIAGSISSHLPWKSACGVTKCRARM